MKGSAITGPVAKEAAELWPVSRPATTLDFPLRDTNTTSTAYCLQLRCCDVNGCLLQFKVHTGGVRAAFYAQASSMIPCHEGISSQTIFSAQTRLHSFGPRTRYARAAPGVSSFLAALLDLLQLYRPCALPHPNRASKMCGFEQSSEWRSFGRELAEN